MVMVLLLLLIIIVFTVDTSSAAPSIGPTVTNTSYLSSTALQLAWRELAQQDLNGVLVRYDIMIVDPANYTQVFNVTSNETSLTTAPLEIYTVYNLSVRAVTEAAPGPFGSPVPQRTDESSKPCTCAHRFFQVTFLKLNAWRIISPRLKMGLASKLG